MLFDSGSSAFALVTSKAVWQTLARPGAATDTTIVQAMGRPVTTYTAPTAVALALGSQSVPLGTVTYMEGIRWEQELMMRFSDMTGMLGNAPFSTHTLILDVRNSRVGLVQ